MSMLIRRLVHYAGNILRMFFLYYLRLSGVKIGKNTMISLGAKVDVRRGKIEIGKDCLITHGCYILSHDGAAHVLDDHDCGTGTVVIGDNVFVGVNTVILRGVRIGNNSIIGAGSVVNKDIPDGVVAAGNPIRIIKEVPQPFKKLPRKH